VFVSLLEAPLSPLNAFISSAVVRNGLLGLALGTTAIVLIHSPWGQRSGAHLNPAVTLAFLRAGKMQPWDALFYVIAQVLGGILGVTLAALVVGSLFTDPPIHYAATEPGAAGAAVAFMAEVVISFILMAAVLVFSSSARLARFTGLAVGTVVALFIAVEIPLSGASMNPARSLASAAAGLNWQHYWIYLLAPTLGMYAAALLHLRVQDSKAGCAKLLHARGVRCIHCGQLVLPKPRESIKLRTERCSHDKIET
jgi:aquaporin Z